MLHFEVMERRLGKCIQEKSFGDWRASDEVRCKVCDRADNHWSASRCLRWNAATEVREAGTELSHKLGNCSGCRTSGTSPVLFDAEMDELVLEVPPKGEDLHGVVWHDVLGQE